MIKKNYQKKIIKKKLSKKINKKNYQKKLSRKLSKKNIIPTHTEQIYVLSRSRLS